MWEEVGDEEGKTNTNPLCLEFEQSACPLLQIYPDFPFCKYLLISTKEKKKKNQILIEQVMKKDTKDETYVLKH